MGAKGRDRVTMLGYQRALSDMIASPRLCLAVRRDAGEALAGYELSDRERGRLATVALQPGMSTSCTTTISGLNL